MDPGHTISVFEIDTAFFAGKQVDRIHVQQLLLYSFRCRAAQRLLLYHALPEKAIDVLTKDDAENFEEKRLDRSFRYSAGKKKGKTSAPGKTAEKIFTSEMNLKTDVKSTEILKNKRSVFLNVDK